MLEDPTLPDPADESARLPMQSFQDRAAALARVRKILFGPTAGSLALRYLDALWASSARSVFTKGWTNTAVTGSHLGISSVSSTIMG